MHASLWRNTAGRGYQDGLGAVKVVKLNESALAGCTVVANRASLVENLPRQGLVAVLGDLDQNFVPLILEKSEPRELHIWGAIDDGLSDRRVVGHDKNTAEIVDSFSDYSWDWVYFAGPHKYAKMVDLIEVWQSRVRLQGYLVFGGYTRYTQSGVEYGVIPAVNELVNRGGWVMAYFLLQRAGYHQVALRRV